MSEERKKIKLFQEHFAWVDTSFLHDFENVTEIISITQFIRESAFKDFGIYINSIADMSKFEHNLENATYKSKSEWLREKMRNKIKEKKALTIR